jgi:HAD superfamily hydrolase (TIGR01509 family)
MTGTPAFRDPLLIFDCDGVLIDSEAIYLDVEFEFLRNWGVEVDRAWYVREFLALAQELWWPKLKSFAEAQTGRTLSDDDYAAMKSESRRRMAAEAKPIAGIHALLDRLTAPRCVASSTQAQFLGGKLERAGLDGYFGDGVYSGDHVEHGKPAPDLFLYAQKQMGHHGPCIVVEDSANGVRGGKAAGHFVIGFAGGSHCLDGHDVLLGDAGADLTVFNHAELADWLSGNTNAL